MKGLRGAPCPGYAGDPNGRTTARTVALHYGTVIYDNLGAADRLDFTVIGPAVNLVSRIEVIAKSPDLPLIVSDDFARAYGKKSGARRGLRSAAPPGQRRPRRRPQWR
jgi:class 3 adenylate cyclase